MKPSTHYTPTENGYAINCGSEVFNRTLYGSHKNDDSPARFFTFAGDAPLFMGAIADWSKNMTTPASKCGVLKSGLCITPGRRFKFFVLDNMDQTSRWFHDSEDISAEFKNGWMEYELTQISPMFPDVRVNIEAYPLQPDDGYLVHYQISTNQRAFFVAGFGGLNDTYSRMEYKEEDRRNFTAADTKGNKVTLGKNRALVTNTDGKAMWVATSFPADFSVGSAKIMSEPAPSMFLGQDPESEDDQVVRISAELLPGTTLDGYVIALRDTDEAVLDKWLAMEDPVSYLKQQIYAKHACIEVSTPDKPLDLTVAPTVIAMDASWHKDAFYHGAFAYHAPFLGWRNWYAPTALGWGDRITTTTDMYFKYLTRGDVKNERVWYDATPIPDGQNKFDKRFHKLENPVGKLPSYLVNGNAPSYHPYNMQECFMDMLLYYIEWSGDLELAEKYYDDLCSMVEFERRAFDPDDDGLYQNLLNTWISDGHNYNGAGCAQSSAYNYRANLVLSKIAKKLGRNGEAYEKQAEKIRKALNEKLWLANDGVIAEALDTVGNCLIHPSVELPTVYHVIDSDMIDSLRAYRTLKFTENHIQNIVTPGSDGRLCYSSNWLPKQYSTCGIFPNENAHLALAYYQIGLKEEAKKLLDGIADCHFTGQTPGDAPHVQSAKCACDLGDRDFSDVSSTYLRLIVEGLFGIRINHLDNCMKIAPGFPAEWDHASLTLKDISLQYNRQGNTEIFTVHSDRTETKQFRIPMRSANIDAVLLDGEPISYEVVAAPNNSFLMIEVNKAGRFQLRVMHGSKPIPTVAAPETGIVGSRLAFEVKGAKLVEVCDVSEALENITVVGNKVYATAKDAPGDHTLFLRAVSGEYNAWLAADYVILAEETPEIPLEEKPFYPVDISRFFNCSMTRIHEQAYTSPRPAGYSMGVFQNGRTRHNWNHYGREVTYVDDSMLRNSGGTVHTPSGIPFTTPAENENVACVSIYDVFPTDITVPLSGKGQEIAVLYVTSAYCMHSYVENARITVTYADGTSTVQKLIYPLNVDDWLTAAMTTEAESFYFSNFNHATAQRVRIDPDKELASIKIEAVANELIMGVAGISISR